MTMARYRTERCDHGLAVGTCEVRTCAGAGKARLQTKIVAKVKALRCVGCRRPKADAVRRGPVSSTGFQRAWCDECIGNYEARKAQQAAPAPAPGAHHNHCHAAQQD